AHFERARKADLAVAFVQWSGLSHLSDTLEDFLQRQGALRLVTGDYLDVTDPEALEHLLDLASLYPGLRARVYQCRERSFHPKAYMFLDGEGRASAFVGSSNLSGMALAEGLEWNYRLLSPTDARGLEEVRDAFDALWAHPRCTELTQAWVHGYRARRRPPARALGGTSLAADAVVEEPAPPSPHPVQVDALRALQATRAEGNGAGLVVLATGLGKTYLAAFDSRDFRRVLFVAHVNEILTQAMRAFRSVRPGVPMGFFHGEERTAEADVVFASVQTLTRHLHAFPRDAFDYVVVDEFHHAHAGSYRRILDHFTPRFLLGLTATPERMDGGDLLALCGENLAFRTDLVEGVRRGLLSPFHYRGVPDSVNYSNIPWRSGRFDPHALEAAVAVEARAENAAEQLRRHGGSKTLAFCCSQRHARFMADRFRGSGWTAAAVFAGEDSDPRAASLERLRAGGLQVLCCVDMFNEGVDVPDVDTVLMLRPTESRVIWLQQLGRGLRLAPGKERLTIIDYVGNHRMFLQRPLALFEEGFRGLAEVLALLKVGPVTQGLPPGCEVTYELEAVEILESLQRLSPANVLPAYIEEFRELHGRRPLAVEAYHDRYNPRAAKPRTWLDLVGLEGVHAEVLRLHGDFLSALETTPMTRSYKMLLLQAMLNLDALPGSVDIRRLAAEFARLAGRSSRLQSDLSVPVTDLDGVRRLLLKDPVRAWTGGWGGTPFFRSSRGKFSCAFEVSGEHREAFQELVRELIEWRLAQYLARPPGDAIVVKVNQSGGRPILHPLDRKRHPELPEGWTRLHVGDEEYTANFVKVAVNVMRRVGSSTNVLPELLREWFGPDAGMPGTTHRVHLERCGGGWRMQRFD
ncbi:MAG: DEAD/DEAH box helicase family protein, partial [Candidatus Eremiobacterota bacterium]